MDQRPLNIKNDKHQKDMITMRKRQLLIKSGLLLAAVCGTSTPTLAQSSDFGVWTDVGVTKKFLLRERKRAYADTVTPDCRKGCAGCGANCLLKEVACDA